MDEPDRVSFLGRPCPRGLVIRTLTLPPGDAVDFHAADWAGALLIVERGELEIECATETRVRFAEGAIVVLGGLRPRRLRSGGSAPLVVSALFRSPRSE